MKVLITGSDGFIGKNLSVRLSEQNSVEIVSFTRHEREEDLPALLQGVDFVFHLAGVNRPQNSEEFTKENVDLTRSLCLLISEVARNTGRKIPVLFSSSIHAAVDTPYGRSKLKAENAIAEILGESKIPYYICRLPGVFGKWAKPNYNSVVATFCYNIAHGKIIDIDDPEHILKLVYIDDVISSFIDVLQNNGRAQTLAEFLNIEPEYSITLAKLANALSGFKNNRNELLVDRVGAGFVRALYSTFISYLPLDNFAYPVAEHTDPRGTFVEMIKTKDSGQISYFTAHPGITRGGHYHHTKTEKFLVIKGTAKFRFSHLITGEQYELVTSEDNAVIVDTIPGWSHDVTNIGTQEMIAIVWANEIFDPNKPDTIACKL